MIKISSIILLFAALANFYSPSNNEKKEEYCGCGKTLKITYKIPTDIAASSQPDANCFAWQEFIALNWLASPLSCSTDCNC